MSSKSIIVTCDNHCHQGKKEQLTQQYTPQSTMSALDITLCITSLRKILNLGLGLYVHIFREIHLLHV